MKTSKILFGFLFIMLLGSCKVKKAYQHASEWNTLMSYTVFLEKYPKSRFSDQARKELWILQEAADWNRIKYSLDIEKFDKFLSVYPSGPHAEDAEIRIGELKILNAWNQALAKNTIIDYEYFLTLYPASNYTSLAREKIRSIQDKRAWGEAEMVNNPEAYRAYLKAFPSGEKAKIARDRIKEIEVILPEWVKAEADNSAYGYKSFLNKYPNSSKAGEAQRRLNDIEDWLWRDAEKKNTVASYERYLRVFPSGEHAMKANQMVFEMEVVQPEWNRVARANTISGFKGFIQKFPQSLKYDEAMSRLKALEDAERREKERIARIERERQRKEREAEEERRRREAKRAAARQLEIDRERYKNYSLSTGATPYSNCFGSKNSCSSYGCSEIKVIAPRGSDVLVTIKKNEKVIRHAYIQAGSSYTFHLENGSYQPFFYFGKGWYPKKVMNSPSCSSMRGGFLEGDDFSKDDTQMLYNNILTYTLIYQRNGNFQTKPSNEREAF